MRFILENYEELVSDLATECAYDIMVLKRGDAHKWVSKEGICDYQIDTIPYHTLKFTKEMTLGEICRFKTDFSGEVYRAIDTESVQKKAASKYLNYIIEQRENEKDNFEWIKPMKDNTE